MSMIEAPDHIPDLTRLKGFYAGIVVMLGLIVARLWFLQIVKGPELAEQSKVQRTRLIRRAAPRGEILDSKGHVLATSRPHFVISVLPDDIKKNPQVLPRLAQLLKTTEDDLADLIKSGRARPFDPVPVADDVQIDLLSQFEEQRLDLPGVFISKEPKRYYADDQICAHVLGVSRPISPEKLEKLRSKGYSLGDTLGVEGLEATFEDDLRGKAGGQVVEVDARGRLKHTLEEIKPTPGHTLRLTIDRDLQRVAYNALKEQMDQGKPGAAVALDPNDGAVLALVSMPSYDLNKFGSDYGKLLKDRDRPLVNRAANSHYPSGSPFKLITAAAGLDSGTTTIHTTDYCPGYLILGRRFNCDAHHGSIDFIRAIGASCDVFFYKTALRAGQKNMAAMAKRFGLGQVTGIDLPPSPDSKGIIPSPEWKKKRKRGPWVPGDLVNMAIGQGDVGVTPLQLANYTAALANGGDLLRPQLVREVRDTSGPQPVVLKRLKREVRSKLGLRPEYRDAIVEGMVRALEAGGTAAGSAIPGLTVAGKTGTAEVFIRGQDANHSVFTCFAPVEHPKIVIAVLVEGGGFGAETAAPIARRMLGQFFHIPLSNTVIVARRHGRGHRD